MSTGLDVFDRTVEETNAWLKTVEGEIGALERREAYIATRAVLHAVRDRLSPGGAARLAAQLPMLLRGVFYEDWKPDETPVRTHTAQDFIGKVAKALSPGFTLEAVATTRGVIEALCRRMNGGAMAKVREELPDDIATLWPRWTLAA
jgi:uncharacterized protein (DUF2267 family)